MQLQLPKIRIQSRALKYGYSNARVCGMRGLLIRYQELEELIRVKSVAAMMELLRRTSYKQDIDSVSGYAGSEALEIAAARNFSRIVNKILSFTPKDDLPAVCALLRKWDLLNIKMIVHAKAAGIKAEKILPYLFAVGSLTRQDLEQLARASGDELFAVLKKTAIGREMVSLSSAAFSKHMRDVFNNALKNMNAFLQVESILDAYTYVFMDRGLAVVGGGEINNIRTVLKKEIDAKNLMIIERLKARQFKAGEIAKYLIKGGTLNRRTVERLLDAKEKQQVLAIIKSRFRGIEIGEDYDLPQLEVSLEKELAKEKHAVFRRSMLSIGVIMGFLLIKEEEINNLRKIAKAKEAGIAEDEIRKMLVTV